MLSKSRPPTPPLLVDGSDGGVVGPASGGGVDSDASSGATESSYLLPTVRDDLDDGRLHTVMQLCVSCLSKVVCRKLQ